MVAVTQDQLRRVIAEIGAKIAAAVQAAEARAAEIYNGLVVRIEAVKAGNMQAIDGAVTSAIAEMTASTLDRVDVAVTAQINVQKQRVDQIFKEASDALTTESDEVRGVGRELEQKLLAVNKGKLDRVAEKLVALQEADKTRAKIVGDMFTDASQKQQAQLVTHE